MSVKEEILSNYTVRSTLTIQEFDSSVHIGNYIVTAENAGGLSNFTISVTEGPSQVNKKILCGTLDKYFTIKI